jgi:hypothetical protein
MEITRMNTIPVNWDLDSYGVVAWEPSTGFMDALIAIRWIIDRVMVWVRDTPSRGGGGSGGYTCCCSGLGGGEAANCLRESYKSPLRRVTMMSVSWRGGGHIWPARGCFLSGVLNWAPSLLVGPIWRHVGMDGGSTQFEGVYTEIM